MKKYLKELIGIADSCGKIAEKAEDKETNGIQYCFATAFMLSMLDEISLRIDEKYPNKLAKMLRNADGLSSLSARMDEIMARPSALRPMDVIVVSGVQTDEETAWMDFIIRLREIQAGASSIIEDIIEESQPAQNTGGRKQRQHGPDNRPPYNRRKNPELGNQMLAWYRRPENKGAAANACAVWAESLFNRKDGCLKGWKLPCHTVLWREAKKQKLKARYER